MKYLDHLYIGSHCFMSTGYKIESLYATDNVYGYVGDLCRALDVLPLKPSRSEGRGKGRGAGQPSRHKPASAKPAGAPKAPRESRSPKRRRAATPVQQPSVESADGDGEAVEEVESRGAARGRSKRSRGRGRGRAAAAKEEGAEDDDCGGEGMEEGGTEGGRSGKCRGGSRGRGGRRGRGRGRGRSRGQVSHDEDVVVHFASDDEAAKQEPLERMSSEQQRKRKGDMEYENQMAMALQVGHPHPAVPISLVIKLVF